MPTWGNTRQLTYSKEHGKCVNCKVSDRNAKGKKVKRVSCPLNIEIERAKQIEKIERDNE